MQAQNPIKMEQSYAAPPPAAGVETFAGAGQPPFSINTSLAPRIMAPCPPAMTTGPQPVYHVRATITPVHRIDKHSSLQYEVRSGKMNEFNDTADYTLSEGGGVLTHLRPHIGDAGGKTMTIKPQFTDPLVSVIELHQYLAMSGSEHPWFLQNKMDPNKHALFGPVPLPFDPQFSGMPAPTFHSMTRHGQPTPELCPQVQAFFNLELPCNYEAQAQLDQGGEDPQSNQHVTIQNMEDQEEEEEEEEEEEDRSSSSEEENDQQPQSRQSPAQPQPQSRQSPAQPQPQSPAQAHLKQQAKLSRSSSSGEEHREDTTESPQKSDE